MNNIDKLMHYLDNNISDSDRKLFTKLSIHIKKSNTRSLNMLTTKYNIEMKKYMFPPNSAIDNIYLGRLEELILFCRKIIEEKIDISMFNVERFHQKNQLDLSNLNKVSELLRQLKTFNVRHNQISVSKELVDSPLMILTLDTKKRLDVDAIKKYTYDYLNNYAVIDSNGEQLAKNSILSEVKKEYIVSAGSASEFKPELLKEAILDYYNTTGEIYYISADYEEKVSRDVHAMIRSKSTSSAKKSNMTYFVLELLAPFIALIVSLFAILLGATTNMGTDLLVYCLFAYTLFNIGLYIYRHGCVKEMKEAYSFSYYEKHPRQFLYFSLIILFSFIFQVMYMYLFSDELNTGLSSIASKLLSLYYNNGAMSIITIVMCVILVTSVGVTLKYSKYHVSEIFTAVAGLLFAFIVGIRGHFWAFPSFRNYSICFTSIGVSLLIYLLIHYNRGRIKNSILLGMFLFDFLLLIVFNDQFYLREILFNIKSLFGG